MIDELLQDRAAIYVAGALTAREREEFELILEFHDEVRNFARELQEVGTALLLSRLPANAPVPSPQLRLRILRAIETQPQEKSEEGFVLTGPDRLVQWVNPAFVAMCGYSLPELRGKSLGPILQGEATDPAAVGRMRRALDEVRPCRETLANYRKDGSLYWADISIVPIRDDGGTPLWFAAREREVPMPLAA